MILISAILLATVGCKEDDNATLYNPNDIYFEAVTQNKQTFISVANSGGGQDTFTLTSGGAKYMFGSKKSGDDLIITAGNLIVPDTINMSDTSVLVLHFFKKDQLIGTSNQYLVPGATGTTIFKLD